MAARPYVPSGPAPQKRRYMRLFTVSFTDPTRESIVVPASGFTATAGGLVLWIPRRKATQAQRALLFGPGTWTVAEEGERLERIEDTEDIEG